MLKKALVLAIALSSLSFSVQAQEREESMVMSAGDAFRRNWNVTLFSIASVENMTYNRKATDTRSIESYNYFGFNYRIDSDSRFSVRIPFLYNTAGQNSYADEMPSKVDLQDVHFAYSKYDLGYIGDIDLSGNIKIYMPTSEYAQNSKMITKIRLEAYFEYAIGRFSSITWAVKPDIFWQRQTAFADPDTPRFDDGEFRRDPRSTTKQYGLEHYLEAVIDVNKYISIKPRVGFVESWYYSSDVEDLEGRHVTRLRSGIGIGIRPMRGLNFTLGIQNQSTLAAYRGKDVTFWEPENTQYSLMTNAYVF